MSVFLKLRGKRCYLHFAARSCTFGFVLFITQCSSGKIFSFMNILMPVYFKHLRAYIRELVSPERTPLMCVLLTKLLHGLIWVFWGAGCRCQPGQHPVIYWASYLKRPIRTQPEWWPVACLGQRDPAAVSMAAELPVSITMTRSYPYWAPVKFTNYNYLNFPFLFIFF